MASLACANHWGDKCKKITDRSFVRYGQPPNEHMCLESVEDQPVATGAALPLFTWQCAIKNVGKRRAGLQFFGPGPASQSLTFIDKNSSLLSTGPGQPGPQSHTSIGQTPHFYQLSQPAPIQKIVSPPNHRCNCSASNGKH